MSSSRRTVVRGAAWSVPALTFASQAPAFAASPPCGAPISLASSSTAPDGTDRANINGWTTTLGSLGTASGPYTTNWTYRPLTMDGGSDHWNGWVFESFRDNSAASSGSTASTTTNTLVSSTFAVVAGRTYTFSFQVRGGWGNNNELAQSAAQRLTLNVGAPGSSTVTTLYDKSTRGGTHTYAHAAAGPSTLPWLDTTASATNNGGTAANLVPITETVSFSPTTTGNLTLRMVITLYARHVNSSNTGGWNVGGDDLMVGIPTITCA